jgi:hypothetical protein
VQSADGFVDAVLGIVQDGSAQVYPGLPGRGNPGVSRLHALEPPEGLVQSVDAPQVGVGVRVRPHALQRLQAVVDVVG